MNQNYLLQSLELAKIRQGFTFPNPSVGALLVKNKKIIATGYHFGSGHPHAEIDAINKISSQEANGSTLYVTLEPCCHRGKTPPCTEAIIKAGIKEVFFGFIDPNPIVKEKGQEALRIAGINCEHFPLPEINSFYESYQYWHLHKKPFVTAKLALSLNAKIAGVNNEPIQITGEALNQHTHFQRKTHCAILTTAKTIVCDNPQLNARYQNQIFKKPLYILDRQLALPENLKIFTTASAITLFYAQPISNERLQFFINKNITCIEVPNTPSGLNLSSVLDYIGKEGVHDLWIEAGGKCFSSLMKEKLIQRAFIYIAPRWIEKGVNAFNEECPFNHLKAIEWTTVGEDVMCELRNSTV